MEKIRTRYAPSPTGFLHIGGARTALFAYLFAKKHNGDFIVRIEDTDESRNIVDGESSQLDNLEWLGIVPDESPRNPNNQYKFYRQSEKLCRYNDLIEKLLEDKKAYKAYDTPAELAVQKNEQLQKGYTSFKYDRNWLQISLNEKNKRDNLGQFVIRLKISPNKTYLWNDLVRGNIQFQSNDLEDWIIKKQNGFPTYNFAVVVDDHDMNITHVFRGEEHITNTPKQMTVYESFNWALPSFGHLTIITNLEGQKLSKRDKSEKQFIHIFKQEGYDSKPIFNFLALLGWTHPLSTEKLSHKELIESFDYKRLSKSPSKFDIQKLNWFAKEYMKQTSNQILHAKLEDSLKDFSSEWIEIFLDTFKENATTINQLKKIIKTYEKTTLENEQIDSELLKTIKDNKVVQIFEKQIRDCEFNLANIQKSIQETKIVSQLNGKKLFKPIRISTTYKEHGPELAKAIFLIGEKIMKRRLKHAINF